MLVKFRSLMLASRLSRTAGHCGFCRPARSGSTSAPHGKTQALMVSRPAVRCSSLGTALMLASRLHLNAGHCTFCRPASAG